MILGRLLILELGDVDTRAEGLAEGNTLGEVFGASLATIMGA